MKTVTRSLLLSYSPISSDHLVRRALLQSSTIYTLQRMTSKDCIKDITLQLLPMHQNVEAAIVNVI